MNGEGLVLVVEDDDDIRLLLQRRLGAAGLRVLTAATGADAVTLAAEHSPDVLLLDVGLPDGDGFSVCERVLAAGSAPAVVFLTARDAVSDRIAGLEAGAVDYVSKPFDTSELLARVHAALRTKLRTDDLARRAVTDPLTGLLNRDGLAQRAAEQVALARHGRPLAAAMLDVDHFKRLNDEHGHAAGDAVLREVARRILVSVRASDVVFRYGGEEFLVLLPETVAAGARAAATKLLEAVSATGVAAAELRLAVTVSAGVACWTEEMATADDLLAAADAALYRAKRDGRARAAVA
jgi:two-component system, cell cycle response regulator